MAHVELRGVSKRFGSISAIRNLSFTADRGSFVALLGPSGCGKSTLLRLIAGLEDPSEGAIFINGRDVTDVEPAKRQIAMVFQSYSLYPHLTVRQNIGFSLSIARRPRSEIEARSLSAAKLLKLDELLDRKPAQLSGGQRQRVAIGRALVRQPEVFLFDEPLSNLDAMLRVQMRLELAKLHRELGVTMIYVTHDQIEAMTLADRIVVLDRGTISQIGSPLELYHRPANRFVASFIGTPAMNFLMGTLTDGGASVMLSGGLAINLPASGRHAATGGQEVEIGIRPENITVGLGGPHGPAIPATVQMIERLGNATVLYCDTPVGPVVVHCGGELQAAAGAAVPLSLDVAMIHVFDGSGRALAKAEGT